MSRCAQGLNFLIKLLSCRNVAPTTLGSVWSPAISSLLILSASFWHNNFNKQNSADKMLAITDAPRKSDK